jgi:hypothetical protein
MTTSCVGASVAGGSGVAVGSEDELKQAKPTIAKQVINNRANLK